MKDLANILRAASGVFAVLPGIAAITTGLVIPPGRSGLFGGVVVALGVLTLIIISLRKDHIVSVDKNRKELQSKLIKKCIVLVSVFFILLFSYLALFNITVIHVDDEGVEEVVYIPISPSGDFAEMVSRSGSRADAIYTYQLPAVKDALLDQAVEYAITDIVLLTLYTCMILSIVMALAISGWSLAAIEKSQEEQANVGKNSKKGIMQKWLKKITG